MKILVTGGAGFIGLNLLRRLLRESDIEVVILDDFSNSDPIRVERVLAENAGARSRVEVKRGDIVDTKAVQDAVRGCDAVIHLAGQTGVGPSLQNARRDLELNILGTFNMLEACRHLGIRRFILASSAATIGNVPPPQREDTPARPLSPYGASKAAAEAYCSAFHRSFGIETLALRFSNVYGPLSWSKGSVVALFAKRALAGQPLVIYGDGTQTRDFLYVEDLVEVVLQAFRAPVGSEAFGGPCNVSTGVRTRIVDLANAFRSALQACGRDCVIEFGPSLQGDVAVSAPSNERVKRLFPQVKFRSLSDSLPDTVRWFIANLPGKI
jgi:UDP-glucose 4-epimerase